MGIENFPHPPLAAGRLAAKLLNRHSPHEIAEAITILIDVLDLLGGDPDLEPNGDELDGTGAEDDFCPQKAPRSLQGPGCPLADPDEAVDDKGCDDTNDDREEESHICLHYGIDQTNALSPFG